MGFNIKTIKLKQYNSSWKYIIIVNDEPICIVRGNRILSNCINYLMNGEPELSDGKIMKIFKRLRKEESK